jgi:hypothetical protein
MGTPSCKGARIDHYSRFLYVGLSLARVRVKHYPVHYATKQMKVLMKVKSEL